MPTTRARAGTLLAGAVCFAAVVVAARPQTPQQQPTFRARTDLVQVDVVAVDAEGRHVRGLPRDAFEVFDRGRRQTIAAFEEVAHTREAATDATLPPAVRTGVASNQSVRAERLVVLVVDDLHIYRRRTERARTLARDVVLQLGADASMAVLFTSGDRSTEVTEDRSRILAAVDTLNGRKGWPRPHQATDTQRAPPVDPEAPLEITMADRYRAGRTSTQEFFDNMAQFKTVQDAARILGAGDVRRKAFVMLSEGMDLSLNGVFDGERLGYHGIALKAMMTSLWRNNVTIYNLDPRGRVTSQDLLRESFPGAPGGGAVDTQITTPDDEDSMFRWNNPIRRAQDGLQLMAEFGGGFAVTDTDDFAGGVGRILEDLDHYYLLGFYPTDPDGKGFRALDVRASRPGLTLRFRRGYEPLKAPAPDRADPLARLVNGVLPATDLPLRLLALPMPLSDREARVHLALEVTIPRAQLQQSDQRLLDQIRYGVFAVDLGSGKVREHLGRGARIALRPQGGDGAPPDEVAYVITTALALPPGLYQLRAAVTSGALDAAGSVFLHVDVPRFSREALALTDLLIGYADGPRVPVARDANAGSLPAGQALPFEPTLDRVFSPRDRLRLFARVVARDPAPLVATISALTAADGVSVLTFDRALAGGESSLDLTLPLAQLPPGPYRLEVRVAGGGLTASREVGFVVRFMGGVSGRFAPIAR